MKFKKYLSVFNDFINRLKKQYLFSEGSQAGTIITFPLSAAIISSLGWESVFYIQAGLTLVWCCAWFLLVSDKPETFKWISNAEKEYITKAIGNSKNEKVSFFIVILKIVMKLMK